MRTRILLIVLVLMLFITGTLLLGRSSAESPPEKPLPTLPPSPSITPLPSPTSTDTPTTAPVELPDLPLPEPSVPELTAVPVVKFVFPTQAPPAKSAWRPPLYPVPWSTTPYEHFFFNRPIHADEVNWPVGNYRYGGIFFENQVHTGVDIAASEGTPVIAAGAGKVVWAGYGLYSGVEGYEKDPYGLAVAIHHNFGYNGQDLYTVYGHLSRLDVVAGQVVETGNLLGTVGDTGFTTGPHLHFEVRLGTNSYFFTYNPELWIAPPQGWGVLAGRVVGADYRLLQNHLIVLINQDTNQTWFVDSYGFTSALNSDPYFQENLVIGDLPEGNYEIQTRFFGQLFKDTFFLRAGQVNYFTFNGWQGFGFSLPAEITPTFVPPTENAP